MNSQSRGKYERALDDAKGALDQALVSLKTGQVQEAGADLMDALSSIAEVIRYQKRLAAHPRFQHSERNEGASQ